jgi:hypothetical protein
VTGRGVAVPATVLQLFLEQSLDEPSAGFAEVRADREHASVDARLDLTLEERRVAEPLAPGAAVAHLRDGPSHAIARRVHTEISQQLERVLGRDPGARHERRAAPMAVRSLKVHQASSPIPEATRDRSPATIASASFVRSRMTCHRIRDPSRATS